MQILWTSDDSVVETHFCFKNCGFDPGQRTKILYASWCG